jgi:hypothetical protein
MHGQRNVKLHMQLYKLLTMGGKTARNMYSDGNNKERCEVAFLWLYKIQILRSRLRATEDGIRTRCLNPSTACQTCGSDYSGHSSWLSNYISTGGHY